MDEVFLQHKIHLVSIVIQLLVSNFYLFSLIAVLDLEMFLLS